MLFPIQQLVSVNAVVPVHVPFDIKYPAEHVVQTVADVHEEQLVPQAVHVPDNKK